MTYIDRREALALFASASTVLLTWDVRAGASGGNYLLEAISGPLALREPHVTGTLLGPEREQLLHLFQLIGMRWDMAASGVGEDEFADLVDSKASTHPSYLTEYREAAALLAHARSGGDLSGSADVLLLPRLATTDFATTRLGRFQKFVSNEFMTWYLMRGGFRRFGYVNYRGYGGGSFVDHSHPPYRTLNEKDQ
jgi:hypothetical protein